VIFTWNADTVRWYHAAAAYTGYYQKLAARLAPLLRRQERFCDMGCGLGLIDLELAALVDDITCVDISETAIAALQDAARARSIGNIRAIQGDAETLPGRWDTIYLSFFSSSHLERFATRAGRLLVVVGGTSQQGFFPEKYRTKERNTIEREKAYLAENGWPYTLTQAPMEFGQPFENRDDARAFVRTYAPGIPDDELEAFLAQRLEATQSPRWPLFFSRVREVGIFEVGPF